MLTSIKLANFLLAGRFLTGLCLSRWVMRHRYGGTLRSERSWTEAHIRKSVGVPHFDSWSDPWSDPESWILAHHVLVSGLMATSRT